MVSKCTTHIGKMTHQLPGVREVRLTNDKCITKTLIYMYIYVFPFLQVIETLCSNYPLILFQALFFHLFYVVSVR